MNIKKVKLEQIIRLEQICEELGIDFSSIQALLDSVRTKKLYKRNNYHIKKINSEIEKAIK